VSRMKNFYDPSAKSNTQCSAPSISSPCLHLEIICPPLPLTVDHSRGDTQLDIALARLSLSTP
jgi:hypothetical protein